MDKLRTVSVILIKPDVPDHDGKVYTRTALRQMAIEDERLYIDANGNLCGEVNTELLGPGGKGS